ncbi:18S rRNA maturation protein [Coemansia spiralis]|nr:18S rRNA maturation protein [Coemansia spiralis]
MPKAAKQQKKHEPAGSGTQLPASLTSCKKQVRSLSRLLNRPGLASTARVEMERKLKALTILQSQMTNAQKDKANATRYHGIKFFERKKIIRRLDKLDKLPAAEQTDKTQDEKERLLVDLNYTTYYPDEHKYISLFPADPSKTTEDTKERREAIRTSIAEAMESGELPKDARLVNANDRKAIRKSNKSMLRRVARALGVQAADGAEDKDDGGGDDDGDVDDEFFA